MKKLSKKITLVDFRMALDQYFERQTTFQEATQCLQTWRDIIGTECRIPSPNVGIQMILDLMASETDPIMKRNMQSLREFHKYSADPTDDSPPGSILGRRYNEARLVRRRREG